ncbi:MAG: elongation factor G [Gemmatimonas sp.]|jgi:elongation factor G|uniref:elongation factor G n=1 Tax=Gemmatimonas sp. TaxID=1962908 RepID=UPI00391F09A6|nr:elongation factor G [Gemmatimonadota bacterium]
MRDYDSAGIRNIAVVGHGGSGKTSLVDALCFAAGSGKRHGTVRDGTALTDHLPEEIDRGYSISLGCAYAEWMDSKINFIDTPGSLDFQGEAIAGLAAADGALCVIGAASGVEVGTERMFRAAVAKQDPVLFVVSMMDKEHADFDRLYQQIKERLSSKVIPVEIPCGQGAEFGGVINLFTQRAYMYTSGVKGEYVEADIPPECLEPFTRYRQELIEAISATDDTLLERYLDGQEIDRDDAIHGMKEAMARLDLFPLFCVSSENMIGVRALLTEVVQLMPNAFEMEEIHALTGAEGHETVPLHAKDDGPFAALVFKTLAEPHVGDVSYFRVLSGKVTNGQEVFNATRDGVEKLGHLSIPCGKDRVEVATLHAGDIGCVTKLRNTHTNDTLSTREHPIRLAAIVFPEAVVHFAVRAAARGEEEKLQQGLHRLHDEDPTFTVHYNPETHETIVGGMGERHLDVAVAVLKRKFGVQAELAKPRIAFRETITARAEGQGRHKKQTGGRGQFGDCWIRMLPMPRGEGYLFEDRIVGGVIPSKYIPAVDRGVQEAAARGVLAGFPLVDFRVEVYDGSTHSVDSNEMSFKMAGILAFKAVAGKCRPVILEPLDLLELTIPDAYLGDVLGDISGRRGHILGTDSDGDRTVVRAVVPQSELHLYATQLSSLTHGFGTFTRRFSGYEQVPPDAAQKIVAEYAREREEVEA